MRNGWKGKELWKGVQCGSLLGLGRARRHDSQRSCVRYSACLRL